jgi:hypothetical protein
VKAIDMAKVHVTHLETDSCYFAVAGDPNKDLKKQLFSEVIKDQKFYDEHAYKFLPNPSIQDSKEISKYNKIADEKKLGGCAIEKVYANLIALGAKCYSGDTT